MRGLQVCAGLLASGVLLVSYSTAGAIPSHRYSAPKKQAVRMLEDARKGLPEIGDSFIVGKFRVVVHSVKCGIRSVGSDGVTVTPKGEFCAIRLTLVNVSKTPAFYSSDSDIAYDSLGRQFAFNDDDIDADTAGNNYANGNSGMDGATVNPSYSLTGNLYFEVPLRDKLTKILLHTAYFPPGRGQAVLLKG